jgi:hypothetical protein
LRRNQGDAAWLIKEFAISVACPGPDEPTGALLLAWTTEAHAGALSRSAVLNSTTV